MKSSRDSLPHSSASFTTVLVGVFRATKAGALYAVIVFLVGFILGTIRVLLLAPRLGETTAVISAEICMGAVFGRSLVDQLAAYGSPAGAIGLAAQVIFAIFPVIQVWRR